MRKIILSLVSLILMLSLVGVAYSEAGMISYWKLNEATGTVANDFYGSNDGTNSGATTAAAGLVGTAYDFDGINDYVDVGDVAGLEGMAQLTIEAWINPASTNDGKWHGIVMKNGVYHFQIGTTGLAGIYVYGPALSAGGTNVIPANRWTHVAGTYDGTYVKWYENGELINTSSSGSGSVSTSVYKMNIGGESEAFGRYFDGIIDEVAIYDNALSALEIKENYHRGLLNHGIMGSLAMPASYIVFKDGSTYYARNGKTGDLDYNGTDAATIIQTCIAALTDGGRIFIKAGTYSISSEIVINKENIVIVGEGPSTILTSSTADSYVLRLADVSSMELGNFQIQTTHTNRTYPVILLSNGSVYGLKVKLHDILIANTYHKANNTLGNDIGVKVGRIITFGVFERLHFVNIAYPIKIEPDIEFATSNHFNDIAIESFKTAVDFSGAGGTTEFNVFDNVVLQHQYPAAAAATGFKVKGLGNLFFKTVQYREAGSGALVAYDFLATAQDSLVLGGEIEAQATVSDAGTNNKIINTRGYFTSPQMGEVTGISTASTGIKSAAVTFETAYPAGAIPRITLTLKDPSSTTLRFDDCYVTSVSNTGFTRNVVVRTAVSGSTVKLQWVAQIP